MRVSIGKPCGLGKLESQEMTNRGHHQGLLTGLKSGHTLPDTALLTQTALPNTPSLPAYFLFLLAYYLLDLCYGSDIRHFNTSSTR